MGRSLIVAVAVLAAALGGCGTSSLGSAPGPPATVPVAPGPPSNFGSSAPHDFGSRGP
jgi:hypothetical protein